MVGTGKIAAITGACQGIGQGIAYRLAEDGYRIAVLDRIENAETVEKLRSDGVDAWQTQVDISSEESIAAAFERMDREFGKVSVLVNAAGIFADEPLLETSVETWDRVMAVNARGPFLGIQEAAKRMRELGGGSIVNLLSTASFQGFAYESAYTASKGAVLLLTRTAAVELAQYGISVNGVGPGTVDTAMGSDYLDRGPIASHELTRTPLGRFGQPADIAEAVAFFASKARWTTGQALYVDGGFAAAGLPLLEGM